MMANMTRKADHYGNVNFISLFGTILSRLAYFNDNLFLENYNKIFGQIITPGMMADINNALKTNDKIT
jgi:hypothetical protein